MYSIHILIMDIIKSLDNSKIKLIKKLKNKKYRDEYELFIAEGDKFLDYPENSHLVLLEETYDLNEKIKDFNCEIVKVSSKIFKEISTQNNSQGVIVVYKIIEKKFENLGDNIVVLDEVRDPGNFGNIIRIVDAVGFKDIIITEGSVDFYNEKTVRSSMGSILNVNIFKMERETILDYLKSKKYKSFVTNLDDKSVSYNNMELTEKNAFIFGNEGKGVGKDFINRADESVIIPIYGQAESLNVSVATGIILYKAKEILEK